MGDFGRVGLPVAATLTAPFAMGTASLATVPITGGAIGAGTAGTTFVQGMSPWMIAANAGLSGLSQFQTLRRERAQQQIAAARSVAEARQLHADHETAERQRRERLKAAVAAERARFGAAGLSSQGGSAAAAISGLTRKADRAAFDAARAYDARRSDLLEAARPARTDGFKLFRKTVSPFVDLFD